jgi:hypothetical protein
MPRTLRRALLPLLVCAAAAYVAVPALAGAAGHRGGTQAAPAATAAPNPPAGSAAQTSTSTTAPAGGGPAAGTAGDSVQYGLGDSTGNFARCVNATDACCYGDPTSCPTGSLSGFWNDPWFTALTSPSSAHRVSYVRLFVSIDAVAQFNGSATSPGCVGSRVLQQSWYDPAGRLHTAGESLQDLMAGLVQAHADGLTPVVSIAGYPIPSSRPAFDAPAPDPTTPAGYWDYRCGVEGILGAVSRLPAADQPHVWESFNEPDTVALYRTGDAEGAGGASADNGPSADTGTSADADGASADTGTSADPSGSTSTSASVPPPADQADGCALTANGVPDGAAKAACDYVLADQVIHQFAGHQADTLLAGVFSRMSPTYLEHYVTTLAAALPGSSFPASWAIHDYSGVTRGYLGSSLADLEAFDRELGTDTGGRAKDLWITEAGMLLNSRTKLGDCPAHGTDPAGTVGACINGNDAAQRTDISAFFSLPRAGVSVPITHLFWYEWKGEANWDSGLLDAGGVPRSAWCAFFGSGTCTGSPNAAGPPA